MSEVNKSALLKTFAVELVKEYVEYDGYQRMSAKYTAPADAKHGAPCIKVEYSYYDVPTVTTRIKFRKESQVSWDSAWDV